MRFRFAVAAALSVLSAAPAHAEWLRAATRHFVIYSDTNPAGVTELATRLETVDAAMRYVSNIPDTPEAAANPVTVYVLDDVRAVEKLVGQSNVAGFYVPRADGVVAFTPRRGAGDGLTALNPQIVLFHEYAHHFLYGNSRIAYPTWFSEGYAEFVSTAKIEKDTVLIGGGANHRAYGLYATDALPLANLFAPRAKGGDMQQEQIYSRGWLLTHFTMLNPQRRTQLNAYLAALNDGVAPLKAATDAFGDLKQLDRELDQYLRRRMLPGFGVPRAKLPAIKVDVRPLTPGERALVEMRMVSTRGVDAKTAGPLYARALKAVAPYPGDPVAQGWLAEMAYDAGRDDEAEAAADRALAADPKSGQALLYKARVHLRRAATAGATDPKVWAEARSWIVKANRADPNSAAALQLFYRSFRMADAKPSASAVAGVHRALELAPQDSGLRFASARQHLADGKLDEAKRTLRPLAFSPHAPADNPAAKLLAAIEAGQAGPAALAAVETPAEDAD
jgi:tetratricopeptide (TPR) repeat protein